MRPSTAVPRVALPLATALALAAGAPRADEAPAPTPSPSPSPSNVLRVVDGRLARGAFVNLPEVARPETEQGADRSLAPYLVVLDDSAGGEVERLPLTATEADVRVAGVIARVTLHQVYENRGARPIEARYVFPASTRAAVHGMRMRIGSRTVEAKIDRRAAARRTYEAAKQSGRRASLLEQQRPNVFTMDVANLMPGDRIEVELDYSELLVPEESVYELVVPSVVGPRYGGGADPGRDQWIANPYLAQGTPSPTRYGVKVHLETGIALKDVNSPSHRVAVRYASPSSADVDLDQPGGGDKDFILRYRLAGDRIDTSLLLLPGSPDGFFALLMEPPAHPAVAEVPPREYIFLVDVSGSMNGFPIETAKALMRDLLGNLRPSDWFNVVLFAGGSAVLSPSGSLPASSANLRLAIDLVDRQQGGGGTELLAGLRAAYGIPRPRGALSRTVVAVTDGYVGVEAETYRFVRERLDEANLFAFGIGSSVNRALIEGMARAGQGEPFVVLRAEKAAAEAERFRRYVDTPVLAGVEVAFEGFNALDVAPWKVPDLMARRPLVVYGRYQGPATGRIVVRGVTAHGGFRQEIEVGRASARPENAALRSLWARKWVELLDDERAMVTDAPELEEAITRLGLGHNLLTAFTSFVAVDSQVVNQGGRSEPVEQPLPLPEGVSNLAVGHASKVKVMSSHASGAGGLGGRGAGGGGSGYGIGTGAFLLRRSAEAEESSEPLRAVRRPAPPATAAPAPAAPPPAPIARPQAKPAPARDPAAKDFADEEVAGELARPDAAGSAGTRSALQVTATATADHGLGDTAALVRAVERALRAPELARQLRGTTLRLRLTVDATGNVTKVEDLGGADALVLAQLRRRLGSLHSATRAATGTGTVEITLQVR